jgi:dTDP-4-dehydrorhamnose 3,5-epimerase
MKVERLQSAEGCTLEGPLLITPQVFGDLRGFFFESWNQQAFAAALEADGQSVPGFVQDNHSRSARGVLRGLHYQLPPHPQGKLVRCVLGEIFDVAVDLRRSSPSFGQWVGARLSGANHHQLWVPEGFAHGFMALTDHAEVLYKTTDFWHPGCERAICWNDPTLAVSWPFADAQVSAKDGTAPAWLDLSAADFFT